MLRDDTTARSNDNVLTMNVIMIPVIIIMTPLYIYTMRHITKAIYNDNNDEYDDASNEYNHH